MELFFYHIVKTWLSIILVYFDRIIASNSERASKKRDARGMALSGGRQRVNDKVVLIPSVSY